MSYRRRDAEMPLGYYVVLLAVAIVLTFVSYGIGKASLTEEVALNAATGTGLTDVEVGPAKANFLNFSCGKGDTARREVTGTNANGDQVTIIVCGGWFKAATVRYP